MFKKGILFLYVAVYFFPAIANAELFKCSSSNGNVTYQDEPCTPVNPQKAIADREKYIAERERIQKEDQAERDRINMEVTGSTEMNLPPQKSLDEELRDRQLWAKVKSMSFISSDDLPSSVKSGIRRHLRQTLRYPDSLKNLEWRNALKMGNDRYRVWVTYRAKNVYGGLMSGREAYTMTSEGSFLFVGIPETDER